MSALLAVTGLTKTFGGVRAVDHCTFGVDAGTVTGLIGPNGSGKTTVFNLVTGYLGADSGRVHFDGCDVTGYGPARLYRAGLSRTFQQARIFPQLTVLENLVVAGGYRWWQLFQRRITCWRSSASTGSPTYPPPNCPTGSASCWSSPPS